MTNPLNDRIKNNPKLIQERFVQVHQIVARYSGFIKECRPFLYISRKNLRIVNIYLQVDPRDNIAELKISELLTDNNSEDSYSMSPSAWYQFFDKGLSKQFVASQSLTIVTGMHSRIGQASSIRCVLQHPLGELQVFRIVFSFLNN